MPRDNHTQFRNRLLSAFAQDDLDEFFSDLHPESFPIRQTLYSAGGLIEHVYFVEEGLASVLTGMENGSTIEVGMIGIEGMVGMPALLGAEISAHQVFIANSRNTAADGRRTMQARVRSERGGADHCAPLYRIIPRPECADRRLQPAPLGRAALCTLAAHVQRPGSIGCHGNDA